jgi:acetoin utilization deacetylase AcuC-like enzyme
MVYYFPEGHETHLRPGHPERPERVETIRDALQKAGWWQDFPKLLPAEVSREMLECVHTPAYLDFLQAICRQGDSLDQDTYSTPASWDLANRSAGGAIAVATAVWERKSSRGFALTRPPGHHATSRRGMGFCLLNNVALASEFLIQNRGASRLAIVDLDLHHGNGTQDIFWRREDVLFISIHQSPLYPGTGGLEETGAGPGAGATANFPLPPGSGDEAYRWFVNELILPLLTRFAPEMILVSFGFDPHWHDPLGHLRLSAAVYGELLVSLARWADEHCGGKIALFLEGGYDLEAAAACSQAAVAAFLSQPYQDPLGPSPRPEGKSWQAVARYAREIWGL